MKIFWLILGLWLSFACTSLPELISQSGDEMQDKTEKEADIEVEEERTVFLHILYYLPSRVFDLFDIARLGVSSGPGIGIDLTISQYFNLSAMTKKSVGLGLQTFRHPPYELGPYTFLNVGPVKKREDAEGIAWYRSPGDIRLEIHIIQLGAHAAVEVIEIVDLLLGFFLIDIVDDDL